MHTIIYCRYVALHVLSLIITGSVLLLVGLFPLICIGQPPTSSRVSKQTIALEHHPNIQINQRITLQLQNVTTEYALRSIAKKASLGIFFNPDQLPTRTITLDLKDVTVMDALNQVLKGTRLEATLQDGDILIKEKKNPSPIKLPTSFRTITGHVSQTSGNESLSGVSVVLKGTSIGTITDIYGHYSLSIADQGGILVFTSIGMNSEEVVIDKENKINVVLSPTSVSLHEVIIVGVGYGTQLRSSVTSSIGSISETAIRAVPVTSIDQIVQGRVAGVQVTQTSGQPGGTVNVRIRGWSSISAGNEPLYVIDGIPFYNWGTTLNNGPAGIFNTGVVQNAMSTLNPNDIESIEVLKDAAAAAIYGTRAANGVVIITTKRGKAGKAQIKLDSYYGLQSIARMYTTLNAQQYAELINESRANARQTLGITSPSTAPAGIQPIPSLENPTLLGQGTNWQKEVFVTAPIQNHQLTISGGTEHTQYALSFGYYNQQGIIRNSAYKRYSVRLNLDQKVSSIFKIGNSITLNNATNQMNRATSLSPNLGGIIYGALLQTPTIPVYDSTGGYARPNYRYFDQIDNPVSSAVDYWHKINTTRMIGNIFGELKLTRTLSFRTSLGLDANFLKNNIFIPTTGWSESPPPGPGSGLAFASQELTWLNENIFTYNQQVARHTVSAIGGITFQGSNFERMISRVFNFPNDLIITTNGGQTNLTNSFAEQWKLVSFLSRINYSFDSKYLLTLAARADGSSRFGTDRRFGFFPSVSAGWRLSQEKFLQDVSFLTELKLRTSYGMTGNSEILNTVNSFANSAHIGSVTTANYSFGGTAANGLAPASLTNQELSWESTSQWNIGVDISLYKNRIQLTLDYYRKNTHNMLVGNTPLPYTSGFSSAIMNVGSIHNQGWEIALNTLNLKTRLNWTTTFNLAYTHNQITSLGTDLEEISLGNTLIRTGEPISSFYGYVVDKIFQSTEEIQHAPYQEKNTSPGDIKFKDVNNDGIVNNMDRTIIGNPLPDYIFGMTHTFTYKGLELSLFLNGVYGNEIVNFTRSKAENMGGLHNQLTSTLYRWRSAQQPGDGTMPRAIAVDVNLNNRFSTRWIEDGSYLRIRTLTLGYNFPASVLDKSHLTHLKVYVTAQNLFTWTHYKGYDPEVGNSGNTPLQQGYDDSNYPLSRTYLIGVTIQL